MLGGRPGMRNQLHRGAGIKYHISRLCAAHCSLQVTLRVKVTSPSVYETTTADYLTVSLIIYKGSTGIAYGPIATDACAGI